MTPMEISVERYRLTKGVYGIGLPIVDAVTPGLAERLNVDADLLAFWVVNLHPELAAFELILEEVSGDRDLTRVVLLYAGMTHGGDRRFHEHRITVAIELEEDLVYYVDKPAYTVLASTQITDESDLVRIRTPRWQLRGRERPDLR